MAISGATDKGQPYTNTATKITRSQENTVCSNALNKAYPNSVGWLQLNNLLKAYSSIWSCFTKLFTCSNTLNKAYSYTVGRRATAGQSIKNIYSSSSIYICGIHVCTCTNILMLYENWPDLIETDQLITLQLCFMSWRLADIMCSTTLKLLCSTKTSHVCWNMKSLEQDFTFNTQPQHYSLLQEATLIAAVSVPPHSLKCCFTTSSGTT